MVLEDFLRASSCAWYLRPFSYLKARTLEDKDAVTLDLFSIESAFSCRVTLKVAHISSPYDESASSLLPSRLAYYYCA